MNLNQLNRIKWKIQVVITTELKATIFQTESIQLYGATPKVHQSKFILGEAGYGALFGKRSGYLEGGVFIGNMTNGPLDTIIDVRFFRTGGGGAAPQGGGFIVHPTIGIGKKLSSTLFIMTELGCMHFVNGDI